MVGLQILERRRQVPAQLVQAFKGLPVANISDCRTRMAAGGPRLRPMHKSGYLAGPALTVKTRPGDNPMTHKALTMAQPGDVIVVDAGGDLTNSLFGEIMVATAVRIGVAGVVLNGAVRDSEEIGEGDADGLLCVPFDDAEAVLAATHKKTEAENKTLADIAAGKLDTAWIDATLKRIGCNTEPL